MEPAVSEPTGCVREPTSGAGAERTALVSPDVATCEECLAEVSDSAARRFLYPFTNCTNCGPRLRWHLPESAAVGEDRWGTGERRLHRPPFRNDGGIALGQVAVAAARLERRLLPPQSFEESSPPRGRRAGPS